MSKTRIAKEVLLWIITALVVLVCIRSGWQKISGNVFWVRDFHRWNYPDWFRIVVGVAELVSAALLVIPRLAGFGASLFAIVMLGAIYTHATHNEFGRLPFNALLLVFCIIIFFGRTPGVLKKRVAAKTEQLPYHQSGSSS